MDFKEIVEMGLEEYTTGLRRALEGLSAAERRYQPTADSNHIDFLVWHIARVEDRWIHNFGLGAREVWQRDAWYQRLGLPEVDGGSRYTAEQVANMPQFNLDDCLAYYDSVRQDTLPYLEGITRRGSLRRQVIVRRTMPRQWWLMGRERINPHPVCRLGDGTTVAMH